jgi:FlaA1/EpsC-like NDP-sugar epimerase
LHIKSFINVLAESSYYTKRGTLLVVDTAMITFALWAAAAMRLEQIWPPMLDDFSWLFIALPLITLPIFIRIGMYRAVIRYTSLDALWVIFVATFYSTMLLLALALITGIKGFPRSVPLIYFLLSFLLLGGSRLSFRRLYAQYYSTTQSGKKVLIYGAGNSGRQMVTAFRDSMEFNPTCFVDDAKELQERDLSGLSIYAPERIEKLIEKYKVDLILLAMPSITRKRKKEILQFLEKFPVQVKSLPTFDELVSKHLSIKDIQDIQIEDLLGRDPVPPRLDLLQSCIADKNVMVTGAGGSIGSELCRQIAENKPKRLILFERSEFALYTIETEMRSQFGDSLEIVSILGSVTHKRRVLAVIRALAVQTIYHAAAYKHVPLVEYNPIEGVRNNLFGTLKTAEAANEGGVETFVLISTDKAVRPTNVMGASKRMAELVLQAFSDRDQKTRFTMVRFGNVLGSSGSVIPHFRKQIKKGGPVTVTHQDVVRYFMTIPEAVQLVIQAGAMGAGGDVFVLDMGEPVRIIDLARNPGEKLYEQLLVGDKVVGNTHPMIMRAEERTIPWKQLAPVINDLDHSCRNFEYEKVRSTLLEIVDGYSPQCAIIDPIWKSMEEKIGKEARKKKMRLLFKKA